MPVGERAGVLLIACVKAANYKLFGAAILSLSAQSLAQQGPFLSWPSVRAQGEV